MCPLRSGARSDRFAVARPRSGATSSSAPRAARQVLDLLDQADVGGLRGVRDEAEDRVVDVVLEGLEHARGHGATERLSLAVDVRVVAAAEVDPLERALPDFQRVGERHVVDAAVPLHDENVSRTDRLDHAPARRRTRSTAPLARTPPPRPRRRCGRTPAGCRRDRGRRTRRRCRRARRTRSRRPSPGPPCGGRGSGSARRRSPRRGRGRPGPGTTPARTPREGARARGRGSTRCRSSTTWVSDSPTGLQAVLDELLEQLPRVGHVEVARDREVAADGVVLADERDGSSSAGCPSACRSAGDRRRPRRRTRTPA